MRTYEFRITQAESGTEVGKLLRSKGFSRAAVTKLKYSGGILLNGFPVRTVDRVSVGDTLAVTFSESSDAVPNAELGADILYDDADIAVRPGLAAGPCLFKDTMQLASFYHNNFFLGHAAMLINEGLPDHLVKQLKNRLSGDLRNRKVAILGMTFKANNDDTRESLSFKLKKLLEIEMAEVLECDPYLPGTVPLEQALAAADGIILGVPHKEYLELHPSVPFVDCWGIWS